MSRKNTYEIQLALSPEQIESYYNGSASYVIARTIDGKSIQFPARALRQVMTREGVNGTYLITTDETNKFLNIVPKII